MDGASEAEGIHARAQGAFSAYLDGELPEPERRFVDEHLAVCIQCRTELTRLKAAVQQLGGMRERAPRSFLADIQKQINTRSKGRFFGRRRLL